MNLIKALLVQMNRLLNKLKILWIVMISLTFLHFFFFSISLPKSSESHVSDVSVPVTFVAKVDADSVDVLIVVSAFEALDVPIKVT